MKRRKKQGVVQWDTEAVADEEEWFQGMSRATLELQQRAAGGRNGMSVQTYIGDGVYAEYDGFGVWLTTERENGTHRIYLEPQMIEDLGKSMARWAKEPR